MRILLYSCLFLFVLAANAADGKVVRYADFGARGDGKTNDIDAIVKAHKYANEHGLPVRADDNATYFIGDAKEFAPIMTDTDWGRARFIIDDRGEIIPMDLFTALIAQDILSSGPATILYDLRSSRAVPECIQSNGGKAIRCRVGHAFIKAQMRENDAVFAGELSGHYYFKQNFTAECQGLAFIMLSNLICKKNSELSHKLGERLQETTLDNTNFPFRLGVGLHVFADTWAHQEFAGINNIVNKVQDLIFVTSGSVVEKVLDDILGASAFVSKVLDEVMPLGHAAAVHCPDMPYLWWKSGERFTDGRKNWDEFMEAAEEIFRILQKVSGEEVTGLSEEQKKKIMKSFKGIQSDNIEERYQEWLRRIHENYFEIEDFDDNDATAEYSIPYIFEDMDFRRQFYDEINDHFDWVRDELEEHDIFVLKSTPIY